jgi:putative ABC transport system permease protein
LGVGVVFGVPLSTSDRRRRARSTAIRYGQLIGFVVITRLIGVLAAVIPARRAARLDVRRAITTNIGADICQS